ncbi:phytosulfokines-like [Rhodamnia argentea]|uniref:Phytosulfokine n=1 Tax=Rhodamnia argentea TaxID=178133 RepID=A0A8B8PVT2_9MYRT|nr:phytosulfokines-like [Rhodamnia argentea]
MAKITTLFLTSLLLLSAISSCFARPEPVLLDVAPVESNRMGVTTERHELSDENCGGLGEEECLVRRTLAAHIDYIYTQEHHP